MIIILAIVALGLAALIGLPVFFAIRSFNAAAAPHLDGEAFGIGQMVLGLAAAVATPVQFLIVGVIAENLGLTQHHPSVAFLLVLGTTPAVLVPILYGRHLARKATPGLGVWGGLLMALAVVGSVALIVLLAGTFFLGREILSGFDCGKAPKWDARVSGFDMYGDRRRD